MSWYRRWERSQALVILPGVLVLAGAAGVILGADAAKSFGSLGGSVAVRGTGMTMLLGGLAVLYGLWRNHALTTVSGMSVGALGAAIFGTGTLISFGTGGIMSGFAWLGIASILLERVVFAVARAKARERIENDQ